ncbi:MAG: tyrosine-type recombinase/integrase [Promethearchaeota archaeon]
MITNSIEDKKDWPSNKEIIKEYLNTFRNSEQSQATRRSCLNYFFDKKYFGYQGRIFDIGKQTLIKYRDYLNHLENLSLSTKKLKWTILKSFLTFVEDYYEEEFGVYFKFPKEKKWNAIHKEPDSNSDVFLTIKEISKLLNYLKRTNFKYYLIFRLFAESGLRKGGLINLDYDNVFLDKRYLITTEKNGRNVYYFSEELRDYLKIYLEERKLIKVETKALFLSTHLKRFSRRVFNAFLKEITRKLKINKNVTCHVFRRSLNALRFEMGCRDPILSILLCQSVPGVNFNNYVKKSLDYERFLGYFDQWNPYKKANIKL